MTKDEVTAEGFVGNDGATYNVTGSQTEVGKSDNTFTYELKKGTNPDNYNIKTVNGELEVTPSDQKVSYDQRKQWKRDIRRKRKDRNRLHC